VRGAWRFKNRRAPHFFTFTSVITSSKIVTVYARDSDGIGPR